MRGPARTVIGLAAIAATSAGAALAQGAGGPLPPQPKDAAAARHIRLERVAYGLINRATQHVSATRPSCRPPVPPHASTATHDAPTQPVLDALAPLRRPATGAERRSLGPQGFGGEVYVDYVRDLVAADGTTLTLVVGRQVPFRYRPSASCLDAQHAWLVHLVRQRDHALRSVALRAFATIRRQVSREPAPTTTPQDGIYLFAHGGGGGGGDIAAFRRHGAFISTGPSRSSNGSRLFGLVPDGVASVTLQYPRVVDRGRYYKPTVYPAAVSRTVAVRDNVIALTVPRPAPDAFPPRMVWRDAAGAVTQVVTQP